MSIKEVAVKVAILISAAEFVICAVVHVLTYFPIDGLANIEVLQFSIVPLFVVCLPLLALQLFASPLGDLRRTTPFVDQFKPSYYRALWTEVAGERDARWTGFVMIALGLYAAFTLTYGIRARTITDTGFGINRLNRLTASALPVAFYCFVGWRHELERLIAPKESSTTL